MAEPLVGQGWRGWVTQLEKTNDWDRNNKWNHGIWGEGEIWRARARGLHTVKEEEIEENIEPNSNNKSESKSDTVERTTIFERFTQSLKTFLDNAE